MTNPTERQETRAVALSIVPVRTTATDYKDFKTHVTIVTSYDDAEYVFQTDAGCIVLCVDVPHCEVCTCAAQAELFYAFNRSALEVAIEPTPNE